MLSVPYEVVPFIFILDYFLQNSASADRFVSVKYIMTSVYLGILLTVFVIILF